MDVTGPSNIKNNIGVSSKKIEKKGNDQFRISVDRGAVSGVNQTSPLYSVQPFYYEEDEFSNKKKRQIARGKTILDELKALHLALLKGDVSSKTIKNLKLLLEKKETINLPPHLQELLDDIETRTEVELAKLERNINP